LAAMKHRAPPRSDASISLRAAVAGLRFLARSPLILATMALDFVATFFAGSLLLMPLYADRILHVGPRGLGLLFAAQPVGAAVGGSWASCKQVGWPSATARACRWPRAGSCASWRRASRRWRCRRCGA